MSNGSISSFKTFAIARYNQDGSLDETFGKKGKIRSCFGEPKGWVNAITIDPNGKILVAGSTEPFGYGRQFAIACYLPDGKRDNCFGDDGIVRTTFTHWHTAQINAIILDRLGRIVVAGFVRRKVDEVSRFALARYDQLGQLDHNFGEDGKVLTPFAREENSGISSLTKFGTSSLAAGGWVRRSGDRKRWALAIYKDDGDLYHDFGGNGTVLMTFSQSSEDKINAVGSPGGWLTAAGSSKDDGQSSFALARYDFHGSLVPYFGEDGKTLTQFGPTMANQGINAMAFHQSIEYEDKIVVGGYASQQDERTQFAIARYSIRGSLDKAFGNQGKVLTSFNRESHDRINAIIVTPNDNIIAIGRSWDPVDKCHQFALASYDRFGQLSASFGENGMVQTRFSSNRSSSATAASLDDSGKIIVGGNITPM